MGALNPKQREAVRHTDTPVLVLAGAGSGKTRVITHKIAYLIRDCGFAPENIAAVTFTNKAAREMQERVQALLGAADASQPRVSTFHTLGLNILRTEYERLGYRRGFSIFDAGDSLALLQELQKSAGDDAMAEAAQWTISAWKSALIGPDEALRSADDPLTAGAARLYAAYERSLKAYNGVDFDDLITQPVTLFREHDGVLAEWRERIRYVLADEYQDTNLSQYELLKLLAGKEGRFTVVGDDDQSIYTWRGANPENLNHLMADYPALTVVKLEQNYRSSSNILATANGLIAKNPHLFDKSLWSANGPGDLIQIVSTEDEHKEVERVVTDIFAWCLSRRSEYGDCAILYRGNHQARLFEQALRLRNIPYHLSGGKSFFDRAEVRDVMAYLRLIANHDNDTALLRIVNTPRRAIGVATLEALTSLAAERECSLLAAMGDAAAADALSARRYRAVQDFARTIVACTELAERDNPVRAVRELIDEIGYEDWLQRTSKDPNLARRRIENVQALLEWLERIAKKNRELGLPELLAQMSLMERLDDDNDAGLGQVRLMTLHAAKGLEFDHVHLVGVEEGLLPHHQNLEGPGVEEERRLAYVGITRARQRLVITYAQTRRRYGETQACEPSRFLAELPKSFVDWVTPDTGKDPARSRELGNQALAELRALLAGD